MESLGISLQSSGIKVGDDKSFLVNLNADPALNELLVYYLKVNTHTHFSICGHLIILYLLACNQISLFTQNAKQYYQKCNLPAVFDIAAIVSVLKNITQWKHLAVCMPVGFTPLQMTDSQLLT